MNGQVLHHHSAAGVVEAIEANFRAAWESWGRAPGATPGAEPDVTWCITGVPHPLFNFVSRAQLPPDAVEARIDEVLARFAARDAPFVWYVGPSAEPPDLGRRLEARGLSHFLDLPGMAADLLALADDPPTPAGFAVVPVRDDDGLRAWADAFMRGFDPPAAADVVGGLFDLYAGLGRGDRHPWRLFLGTLDGRPVATSALFAAAGVAGLHLVATVPEARRRGIGTALTLAALREGRALGYRVGILLSSPMGLPIYRRLGFVAHCSFALYVPGH
jgi:GNAT superfamily N-acetyltransferase